MEIVTKRCHIRPFCEGDIDACMAYRNNAQWKYQSFKGLSREQYREALLGGSPDEGVQLDIVCRRTGELLGDLYLRREGGVCWLGYTVAPEHARQGYAFEAAPAAVAELAARGVGCMMAGAEAENTASAALLKKLGFTFLYAENGENIYSMKLQ